MKESKKQLRKFEIVTILLFSIFGCFAIRSLKASAACGITTELGRSTSSITITQAGIYKLWFRIKPADKTNNAAYVQIDNGTCFKVGDSSSMTPGSWTWVNYGQTGSTQSQISNNFTTGSHTLAVIGNEPNVQIDRSIILTKSDNCIPSNQHIGNNEPGDNCLSATNSTSIPNSANSSSSSPEAEATEKAKINSSKRVNKTNKSLHLTLSAAGLIIILSSIFIITNPTLKAKLLSKINSIKNHKRAQFSNFGAAEPPIKQTFIQKHRITDFMHRFWLKGDLLHQLIFVVIFAGVAISALILIHAAPLSYSIEPESGNISGRATIVSDSTASGNKSVQFNATPVSLPTSASTPPVSTKPATQGNPKPTGFGQANGPSGTWNIIFNDNFDGATLNTANWSKGFLGTTAPVQSQMTSCHEPDQVVVENGMLKLKTILKETTCNKGTNPHPYASGAVDSHGKKEYSYGYFEARIWLDASLKSDGTSDKIYNWPAWWLDGTGKWPMTGELDIMEGMIGNAKGTWHGPQDGGANHPLGNIGPVYGWHVFAAEWAPGIVTTFYDGTKIGSYSSSNNITSSPQFMILGLQMSPVDEFGGPIKAPSEMDIDYVRVWQR